MLLHSLLLIIFGLLIRLHPLPLLKFLSEHKMVIFLQDVKIVGKMLELDKVSLLILTFLNFKVSVVNGLSNTKDLENGPSKALILTHILPDAKDVFHQDHHTTTYHSFM